ncbi:glycosyltransferase [Candidatus Gottesmanbacteria bacterium]|nr:glycosyltransferase [Candidatus Gottesmanbacteria bacterium]
MRVLFLSPLLPYPLFSGGQIRAFNLIKELSQSHQITLFSFIRSEEERRYLPQLQKFCSKIVLRKRRKAWTPFNVLLTGFSYYPFLMSLYWDPVFTKMINEELIDGKYDLIHVETFYLMHTLPSTTLPIVLSEQNIEYLVFKRFAERANLIFKLFLYFDVAKLKIWEKFFWQKAKKIVTASTLDKQIIEKKRAQVSLVPNGVDLEYFRDLGKKPHNFPTILFVGNFKWLQNRDAGNFLITEIWPNIRKEIPGAKLLVVGRDAPQKLKEAIVESGAVLREDVAEITEVYQETDLLLAPIRIGGGTKFKILESMAAGIPVVTTKEGIEGLEVKDGQEVLVGETEEELIRGVIKILENKKLRVNLAYNARKKILAEYNWQKIGKELERVWQEAVKNG